VKEGSVVILDGMLCVAVAVYILNYVCADC
jgi:hypothetical protein